MKHLIVATLLLLCACTPTPAPTVTPTPEPTPPVWVRLKLTITDNVTGQPVKATVKRDGKIVFEKVDYCEVILPADTKGEYITIRVVAPGYSDWELSYNLYQKKSQWHEVPVRLDPLE